MAYKLYINNKLFNGIGNNNYNKGSITINGTTYQFDNSSSVYVPTVYDYDITDPSLSLPNYITITTRLNNIIALETTEYNYTSVGGIGPMKLDSKGSVTIEAPADCVLSIIFVNKSSSQREITINGSVMQSVAITDYQDISVKTNGINPTAFYNPKIATANLVSGQTYTIARNSSGSGELEILLVRLEY